MKIILRGALPLACLMLLGACGRQEVAAPTAPKAVEAPKPKPPEPPKPETVQVVAKEERSRHFLAVQRQLELGGTMYGYVDVDGDVLTLATGLRNLLGQMAEDQPQVAPFVKQDYPAIAEMLGLTDVRAVGLSSVDDGTGYFRNRLFIYMPGGRHGLMAGLGGAPAPFARLALAPADADIYAESEIDLPEVYQTVRAVVTKVGGDSTANLMEDQLKLAGQKAAFSFLGLIQGWKGRSALVLRLDAARTLQLPGPKGLVVPLPSVLLSIDAVGPVVADFLGKSPEFTVREEGGLRIFESKEPLPLNGIRPVLAVDGGTLYFATTVEFLQECRQGKGGLAQSADFNQALARLGPEGNGLSYCSPKFFKLLQSIEQLNPEMPAEAKRTFKFFLAQMPQPDRPLVSVRTNLPDGILVRSYWNRSLKQDTATLMVYNPVTIGLMAAMAVPAFQKVRTASQEKAVLNNLRQLSAAADQYYLENGTNTARYEDLVGPDKYVKELTPVADEHYRVLVFRQGEPLRLPVPALRKVVEYRP